MPFKRKQHIFLYMLASSCARSASPSLAAWAYPARVNRRAWLRLLLVAMWFSALHGVLGAWVVSAMAPQGQAVVEVCTPTGLQWVSLEATPAHHTPTEGPPGLAQACVWAAAWALQLPLELASAAVAWATAEVHLGPWPGGHDAPELPSAAAAVLLMSPMRAPPG